MFDSSESLIHAYLDGILDEEQTRELGDWIQAEPENARRFARISMLHDQLHNRISLTQDENPGNPLTGVVHQRKWSRKILAMASAAILLFVIALPIQYGIVNSKVSAAVVELNRIMIDSREPVDRTYLITPGDDLPYRKEFAKRNSTPPLNGAILHVRGPSSYVLVRRFENGDEFVTGSDGKLSWALPPSGPVRVSHNADRFRGAIPGQQHNIPFINLQDNLQELASAYHLELVPDPVTEGDLKGLKLIKASRRQWSEGGPRNVWIWYEPASGQIRRMRMDRLPMARGGPRSITLDLTATDNFPGGFYSHEFHHEPDRKLIEE